MKVVEQRLVCLSVLVCRLPGAKQPPASVSPVDILKLTVAFYEVVDTLCIVPLVGNEGSCTVGDNTVGI